MLSAKPTVSVVIPTHNRAAFLKDAVQSVIEQELDKDQQLQVIVVDDGSTDDTEKIVKEFGRQVEYYKINHSGIPAVARNFGIGKAKADLIAFQDSDDLWLPGKLKQQLSVFDDPAVALCYGNGTVMEADGELTKQLIVPFDHQKSGYIFKDLVLENFISTLTVIVRKSCLKKLGGFNESVRLRGLEDYELWLRLSGQKLGKVKAIKKPLASYRRHDQNVSLDSVNHPLEDIVFALSTARSSAWSKMADPERRYLDQAIDNHQKNLHEYKRTSAPLVSIVMSVYNAGDYLKEAIGSILDQTYQNFEFIIIDDGSTDDSWKTIQKFSDKRIYAIRQKNKGLQGGLNAGIGQASGVYIARMDQDDISNAERIEKQVRFLEFNTDIAIVGTNFSLIDETSKVIEHSYYLDRPEDLNLEVFTRNPFGHGTVMLRASALKTIGLYDKDEPVEDYQLWWRILKNFKGANLTEELYRWRVLTSSMSHSASDKRQPLIHNLIKKIWLETPLPSVSYYQIRSGLEHYSSLSPDYGGQYMFMLSTLCLGAFRMRRYVYGAKLLLKLLVADKLFAKVLRTTYEHQTSREYLLVHIHPN